MYTDNNILQELTEISPVVANLKATIKGDIYRVPEDYFETLEINILEKTILHNDSLNQEVPDGYFEGLEAAIFAKIEAATPNRVKKDDRDTKIYRMFGMFSKIAAVFLISFIAIKGLYFDEHPQHETSAQIMEDQISQQDVMSYIEENLHEFEDEDLLALNNIESTIPTEKKIMTSTTENAEKSLEINDYANPGEEVTEEDIQQYLEENIHDISLEDINTEIF